jgi:tetratricopeptide (TPR) repeat protein
VAFARRVPWLAGLVGLLALAPLAARAEVPAPAQDDEWMRARTRNFTIYSNAGELATLEVARQLERLCEVIGSTNPGLRSTSPRPTQIFAFQDDASFNLYRPRRTEDISGWFETGSDRDMIAFNLAPRGREWAQNLFHEFTHSYLGNNFASLPLWLNEGLAEYYGVTQVGSAIGEIGHPIAEHSAWCRDHPLLGLSELFAMSPDSPDYLRSGDRRHTFYAESWLLIHHLLHSTSENARIAGAYLSRLRVGEDPEVAFAQLVPRERWDLLLFEAQHANEKGLQYARYTFRTTFATGALRCERASRAEILCELGNLVLYREEGARDAAEEHFRAAIAHDSDHAPSLAALGYVADLRGQSEAAEERYAQAVVRAGEDARPWMIAGLGTLHRFSAENPEGVAVRDSAPPLLRRARERFARVLALEPDNPVALASYGKTFTSQLQPSPQSIDALERAALALPARTDVLLDLVLLVSSAGGHPAADRLLHGVLAPRLEALDPRQVEDAVMGGDLRRADWLAAQGRGAAAAALVRYVADQARDPHLREAAGTRLPSHARPPAPPAAASATVEIGKPVPPDQADAYNTAVAFYNQGVTYANHGQYKQALEWLERAHAVALDDSLRADTERRLAEVRGNILIQDGIALYNSGKLVEARKQLAAALRLPLDPGVKAYVRRFVREIDDLLAPQH